MKIVLCIIVWEVNSLVSTSSLTYKSSFLLNEFVLTSPKRALKKAVVGIEIYASKTFVWLVFLLFRNIYFYSKGRELFKNEAKVICAVKIIIWFYKSEI